jgi:transposase
MPKSLIGKGATYLFNQWEALNSYREDSDLSIDNNATERAMKPVAIGRKNGLFVGSPHAGCRVASLMTFSASCKAKCVEPRTWLRDVQATLLPGSHLELLLPSNWLKDYP